MPTEEIRIEIETAWLREIQGTWHQLNASHFRRALAAPVFCLVDGRARLGQWTAQDRTLALARALVLEQPWGTVVEVLKHEMAHQFIGEVMGISDQTAHGPAFRELCARLAIDASASGLGGATSVPAGSDGARILGRVAKLLALAESPNQHEAEAAMAAAQRLMLKYNLSAPSSVAGYGFRHLGRPTGRTSAAERTLAVILEEHFFVEVIWVPVWRSVECRRGSVLEICGTPENLEMASYVYDFLMRSSEMLWRDYRHARRLAGDRERRVFLAGVMEGFHGKLGQARVETRREGLVWVGDPLLSRYYRQRHPHIRRMSHAGPRDTGAHSDGKAAGQTLVLNRPVKGATDNRRLALGKRTT